MRPHASSGTKNTQITLTQHFKQKIAILRNFRFSK